MFDLVVEHLFFRLAGSRRSSILSSLKPSLLSAAGFERGPAEVNALTNKMLLTVACRPIAHRRQAGAPVHTYVCTPVARAEASGVQLPAAATRHAALQPSGSFSLQFSLLTFKLSRLAEFTLIVSRSDQLKCIAQRALGGLCQWRGVTPTRGWHAGRRRARA